MAKKPPKAPARSVEGASCAMCGSALTREHGPLMCSNKECVAFRGKLP